VTEREARRRGRGWRGTRRWWAAAWSAPARAAGRSSRAGHPVAAKTRSQGRCGLRPPRLLLRKGRPLTGSFPGKIGAYREDGSNIRPG
jgi:hypothetical protein